MTKATVKKELEEFLASRKARFPNVTEEQKDRWVNNIFGYLESILSDNDIYYDGKPDDVIADYTKKI